MADWLILSEFQLWFISHRSDSPSAIARRRGIIIIQDPQKARQSQDFADMKTDPGEGWNLIIFQSGTIIARLSFRCYMRIAKTVLDPTIGKTAGFSQPLIRAPNSLGS
jgi:hypothetical protein